MFSFFCLKNKTSFFRFFIGSICKHIDWANILYYKDNYSLKIDNVKIRQKLFFVATGKNDAEKWLMPLVQPIEPAGAANQHESNVDQLVPITNFSHQATITDENNQIAFEDLLKRITEQIKQKYEKSPGEVFESTRKMLENMEKINTVAAFSSAMTTFGLSKYPI